MYNTKSYMHTHKTCSSKSTTFKSYNNTVDQCTYQMINHKPYKKHSSNHAKSNYLMQRYACLM
ncbi:hypothetical protein Hanom_Chr08g00733621 [Helianthus anomalus]